MNMIIGVTLKGIFRDRVFQGILTAAVLFLAIPSVSTLSMRQVTELSITLSLSLVSFIMLLLAVFLGGTSIWRDIERRYTFSVLSLPLTRSSYLFGRFAGIAIFLLLTAAVLAVATVAVVFVVSGNYPPERPVAWGAIAAAVGFDALKYIFLVAFAVLFSSVSTSFFLPIFGTITIFLVGGATQQVYDYVHSQAGQALAPLVRQIATALYYVLPNFSAFDLKVNAIYALKLNFQGLVLTAGYFSVYTAIVLFVSAAIFSRREMK
ncbi:ABC-2 family transporter protein [Geobacter sp. OR-1]|uniref:ABC transporter permease n=1 Tax=Geobacter sp. OR-1 TaxID=1266765 RepID=UPI000543C765|nr:ABC transporter permease subunit [Geobacter sp. OR-1]GAM11522.1 ABC-2 family transporter protein [Geobacter sp. OR-1]